MFSFQPPPPDPRRQRTLDYRFNLTRDLLTNLHRGECCAVVGVGSCGKSRLLRHITLPETMRYHLGNSAYNHVIVLVECNAWLNNTIWAAYEGMTRSLFEVMKHSPHPALQQGQQDLNGMYEAVVNERDLAFKHVITGLNHLLGLDRALQLTFCFDEFDFVFEKFDAQLFRNLRAMRNQHKYRLTYLVATRSQLPYQRPKETWPEVEEFYELFADNTFAIGPYDEKDAADMVADLEARYEYPLEKPTRDLLLTITGGHPGLIGASYRLLESLRVQPGTPQEIARLLINEQSTWKECLKIWDSLRAEEHGALKRLAQGRLNREDGALLAELKAKGLVHEGADRTLSIFSPIFADFVRQFER